MRLIAFIWVTVFLSACSGKNHQPEIAAGDPIQLSSMQTYTVRDYVSSEFFLPRAVRMHPMSASQSVDGVITVCGLADAIGQEGPGDAMAGYRAYTGMLAPGRDDFIVTRLASSQLEQRAIVEICRQRGAPIIVPAEIQRVLEAAR